MKAITTPSYGSPDVLRYEEIPKPSPKPNEVLVRVSASVVGPADCAFRKGEPFIVKLIYGLSKPKFAVLGAEFAGVVEEVGSKANLFKKGDRVFGLSADTFGAHAEYLCLPESKVVAVLPEKISFEEGVSILDGGLTALTFLHDVAKVNAGQKVLINGASGAVGIYGVQMAKLLGAEVTGVCSGANSELVKANGADSVIDYTRQDFTSSENSYDVIFDAVGKSSFSKCKMALKPGGIYLTTVPTGAIIFDMLMTSIGGGKKARFATAGLMQNKANLEYVSKLFLDGHLKPVIDRRYKLEQTAEAHRYVETERKRGNVVLNIGGEN